MKLRTIQTDRSLHIYYPMLNAELKILSLGVKDFIQVIFIHSLLKEIPSNISSPEITLTYLIQVY